MINIMQDYQIEKTDGVPMDYGFSSLDCHEPRILAEGQRSYAHAQHGKVLVPTMRLQGITSPPEWDCTKMGSGSVPSCHFKVLIGDGEDTWWMPVSAFRDAAKVLAGVVLFRQAFVRLSGDVSHSEMTPTFGPREGLVVPITSLAVNFASQARILAVFAPMKDCWAVAAEALSKKHEGKTETEVEELPF